MILFYFLCTGLCIIGVIGGLQLLGDAFLSGRSRDVYIMIFFIMTCLVCAVWLSVGIVIESGVTLW